MCESILTIALVCTVKYLHYCDYYYTLGNDSQSTPKLIAYVQSCDSISLQSSSIRDFKRRMLHLIPSLRYFLPLSPTFVIGMHYLEFPILFGNYIGLHISNTMGLCEFLSLHYLS